MSAPRDRSRSILRYTGDACSGPKRTGRLIHFAEEVTEIPVPNEFFKFVNPDIQPCATYGDISKPVHYDDSRVRGDELNEAERNTPEKLNFIESVFKLFTLNIFQYEIPAGTLTYTQNRFTGEKTVTESEEDDHLVFSDAPTHYPFFNPNDWKHLDLPDGFDLTPEQRIHGGATATLINRKMLVNLIQRVTNRTPADAATREFFVSDMRVEEQVFNDNGMILKMTGVRAYGMPDLKNIGTAPGDHPLFEVSGFAERMPLSSQAPLIIKAVMTMGTKSTEFVRREAAVLQKILRLKKNDFFPHVFDFIKDDHEIISAAHSAPFKLPRNINSVFVLTGATGTLEHVVRNAGPLSTYAMDALTIRMIGAIEFLHNNGIYHLNITPKSIWLPTPADYNMSYTKVVPQEVRPREFNARFFPHFRMDAWMLGDFTHCYDENDPYVKHKKNVEIPRFTDRYTRHISDEPNHQSFRSYDRYCMGCSLFYAATAQKPFWYTDDSGQQYGCDENEVFFNSECLEGFPLKNSFFTIVLKYMFHGDQAVVPKSYFTDRRNEKIPNNIRYREQEQDSGISALGVPEAGKIMPLADGFDFNEVSLTFDSEDPMKRVLSRANKIKMIIVSPKTTVMFMKDKYDYHADSIYDSINTIMENRNAKGERQREYAAKTKEAKKKNLSPFKRLMGADKAHRRQRGVPSWMLKGEPALGEKISFHDSFKVWRMPAMEPSKFPQKTVSNANKFLHHYDLSRRGTTLQKTASYKDVPSTSDKPVIPENVAIKIGRSRKPTL